MVAHWQRLPRRQCNQPLALAGKKGIAADYQSVGPLCGKHRERLIEVTCGAGVHDMQPQPDAVRGSLGLLCLRLGLRRVVRIDEPRNRWRGGALIAQMLDTY